MVLTMAWLNLETESRPSVMFDQEAPAAPWMAEINAELVDLEDLFANVITFSDDAAP